MILVIVTTMKNIAVIFQADCEEISPDENESTTHAESPLDEVGAILEEVGDGSCGKVLWVTFIEEV